MANPEHFAILKQGVEVWNKWRKENPKVVPDLREIVFRQAELDSADLSQADLSRTDLTGAEISNADLSDADFTNATLNGAYFDGSDLSRAKLAGATLTRGIGFFEEDLQGDTFAELANAVRSEGGSISNVDTDAVYPFSIAYANYFIVQGRRLRSSSLRRSRLVGADLSGADLSNADLAWADFSEANICGANLDGAFAAGTKFADVDLSAAIGVESMRHHYRSTIGVDTIYKSKGNIPEVFLRGCGVPDEMIAYIRSIAGAAQFYSCFISHSTQDKEFANRLYADLQAKGVRCWFAPDAIRGGRKIHGQIDEAIRLHDKLLLILSEHSMSSDWVQTEIAKARKREAQEKRQMLFPVTLVPFKHIEQWECFDADRGKDSAREVREYFIPDFSNWKEQDSYQKAFDRLVSHSKASR